MSLDSISSTLNAGKILKLLIDNLRALCGSARFQANSHSFTCGWSEIIFQTANCFFFCDMDGININYLTFSLTTWANKHIATSSIHSRQWPVHTCAKQVSKTSTCMFQFCAAFSWKIKFRSTRNVRISICGSLKISWQESWSLPKVVVIKIRLRIDVWVARCFYSEQTSPKGRRTGSRAWKQQTQKIRHSKLIKRDYRAWLWQQRTLSRVTLHNELKHWTTMKRNLFPFMRVARLTIKIHFTSIAWAAFSYATTQWHFLIFSLQLPQLHILLKFMHP